MSIRQDFEDADRQTLGGAIYLFISRIFWVGGLWFASIYIWSVAFDVWPTVFLILGLIVGLLFGIISGGTVASQTSKIRANQMKFASSYMMLPPALVILVLGLIVWGVRSQFF